MVVVLPKVGPVVLPKVGLVFPVLVHAGGMIL